MSIFLLVPISMKVLLLWKCLWERIRDSFCFWRCKDQPEASFLLLCSSIYFPIRKSHHLTRSFVTITREFSFFPITYRKEAYTKEQLGKSKMSDGEKKTWDLVTVDLGVDAASCYNLSLYKLSDTQFLQVNQEHSSLFFVLFCSKCPWMDSVSYTCAFSIQFQIAPSWQFL